MSRKAPKTCRSESKVFKFTLNWSNSVDLVWGHKTSKASDDENMTGGRSKAPPCLLAASEASRDVEEEEKGKSQGCIGFPGLHSPGSNPSLINHRCQVQLLRMEWETRVFLFSGSCLFFLTSFPYTFLNQQKIYSFLRSPFGKWFQIIKSHLVCQPHSSWNGAEKFNRTKLTNVRPDKYNTPDLCSHWIETTAVQKRFAAVCH